jgi:hypothetical protein
MNPVPYTCRICHMPGTADGTDSFDKHVNQKWTRMLCHDQCYVAWIEQRQCEERIQRACRILIQLGDGDSDERAHILGRIRVFLTKTTKHWAKNECAWMWSKVYYWNKDMVDLLVDKPTCWTAIIRGARDFIRQQCIDELGENVNPQWRCL